MFYKKSLLIPNVTIIIGIFSIPTSYALDLSQYTDISDSVRKQLLEPANPSAGIQVHSTPTGGVMVKDITVDGSHDVYFTTEYIGTTPANAVYVAYGKNVTVNKGSKLSGNGQLDDLTINGGYGYIAGSNSWSGNKKIGEFHDSKINNTKIFSDDDSVWGKVDILGGTIADKTLIGDHGWLLVNRVTYGIEEPYNRATATNTTVEKNGMLSVYEGGTIKDTTVTGGTVQLFDGSNSANKLGVNSGFVQMASAARVENLNLQNSNSALGVFFRYGSKNTINNRDNASIDNLTNNGVVLFNGDTVGTLNVQNATGTGTFNMHVAGMTGDFLNITKSVAGQFKIAIEDKGTDANRTSEGYHLVHANGSASNSFQLVNGAVDLGAYRYYLNQQGDDWILSQFQGARAPKASNATRAVMAMSNVLPSVWDGELMTLRGRLGEIRQTKGNGGVWMRSLNNRYRISGTDAADYTQDMNGVMVGADKVLDTQHGQLILGGLSSYSRSDIDFNQGGGGHVDSYSLGGYITWLLHDGYYVDGVVKANHYDVTTNARTYNGYKAKGDYRTTGIGASIEAGKTIKLNNFFVEPYLKLSTFNAASKSYHLSNGMKVKAKDAISYKAEVGSSVGYSYLLSNGMTIQPYAKISVAQELNRHNSTIINDNAHFNNNMSGTTGWYGVGVNAQLSKNWSTYGEISYGNGKHIESPYNAGVGIRYNF